MVMFSDQREQNPLKAMHSADALYRSFGNANFFFGPTLDFNFFRSLGSKCMGLDSARINLWQIWLRDV